jgi:hypothetical protein
MFTLPWHLQHAAVLVIHPFVQTPGTGLYSQLEKYKLPRAEAIFELGYFRKNPKPFCTLAKELYPGDFSPTPAHYFIKLLSDKYGLLLTTSCFLGNHPERGFARNRKCLLRCYTQNIDGLEFLGTPDCSSHLPVVSDLGKLCCL